MRARHQCVPKKKVNKDNFVTLKRLQIVDIKCKILNQTLSVDHHLTVWHLILLVSFKISKHNFVFQNTKTRIISDRWKPLDWQFETVWPSGFTAWLVFNFRWSQDFWPVTRQNKTKKFNRRCLQQMPLLFPS